jgi:hypothetical protein
MEHSFLTRGRLVGLWGLIGVVVVFPGFSPSEVRADAFATYAFVGSFELPEGNAVFDVLPDGRIIVLVVTDHGEGVYTHELCVESTLGSREFTECDPLPGEDTDMAAPAFIRVSPDGTKLAVGNNGGVNWDNYQVAIVDLIAITAEWFPIRHWDAEWYDDTRLAITADTLSSTGIVSVFDISLPLGEDPQNPVEVIVNIGGASAGVTFDTLGNLYTGNGLQYGGPSGTGLVKVFENDAWMPVLGGAEALDFEGVYTEVVDILSAASLGFDSEGSLHVGGGDFSGGPDDFDCAALVRSSAVAGALAGQGPADPDDLEAVRRFDPDWANTSNFYVVNYNPVTSELYMVDFWATTVYAYAPPRTIPAVSQWGLVVMVLSVITLATLIYRRPVALSKVRPEYLSMPRTWSGHRSVEKEIV